MRDAVDAVDVCRDLLSIIDDRPGDGGLTFKIIDGLTLDAKAQYELIPLPSRVHERTSGAPAAWSPVPRSPVARSPVAHKKGQNCG